MNNPTRYPFFSPTGSYLKVRREDTSVIIEQGDLQPYKLRSFEYGQQKNPLEQAAQWKIEEKDPLIIDDEDDFSLIDDEDKP